MSENFAHQTKLFDPLMARRVILIGAGAIGSWTALVLTKMGVVDFTAIDHDVVASHNGPMSLYANSDIGRPKVEVLQERIELLTGVTLKVKAERYDGEPLNNATVICCVDDMDTRAAAWQQVKGRFDVDLFVDTRTAAAFAEVYAISPRLKQDQQRFEGFLFPQEQAAIQMCGEHGVAYVSAGVASMVGSVVTHFWQTGQKSWRHERKYDTLEII